MYNKMKTHMLDYVCIVIRHSAILEMIYNFLNWKIQSAL
jgi:hypothetical protein